MTEEQKEYKERPYSWRSRYEVPYYLLTIYSLIIGAFQLAHNNSIIDIVIGFINVCIMPQFILYYVMRNIFKLSVKSYYGAKLFLYIIVALTLFGCYIVIIVGNECYTDCITNELTNMNTMIVLMIFNIVLNTLVFIATTICYIKIWRIYP